jgi:hypothetical protein
MLERSPASGRFVRRLNAWLVILSSSFADPPQQQMRRSTIGPVRFRSRWPTRFAGPIGPLVGRRTTEIEEQVSALRDSLGMGGRRFELVGAAWFTGSRSSRRPDTLPAIGPFAQPGLLTYPLPLRDVVLVRGGHSTPLHADPRRDDRVSRSAADQPQPLTLRGGGTKTVVSPLNQPAVPTRVLTCLGSWET